MKKESWRKKDKRLLKELNDIGRGKKLTQEYLDKAYEFLVHSCKKIKPDGVFVNRPGKKFKKGGE